MSKSSDLERLLLAGLGQAGEQGGLEGVTVFEKRRADPIPRRYYPGDMLSDQRNKLAINDPKAVSEAVQGVWDNPFEELYGFSQAPKGHLVKPLLRIQANPELPFGESNIYPALEDPKETEKFIRRIQQFASSGKYSVVKSDVDQAVSEIRRLGNNYHLVYEAGLNRGPGYYYPTFEKAFKHALLHEAAIMAPSSADMATHRTLMKAGEEGMFARGWRGSGELARSNFIEQLFARLAVLKAKGLPTMALPGPMRADTLRMYQRLIGPSVGLRSGRGLESAALQPELPATDPIVESVAKSAKKNLRALSSYEVRKDIAPSAMERSPEETYQRMKSFLEENLGTRGFRNLASSIADNVEGLERLKPDQRVKALFRELKDSHPEALDSVVTHMAEKSSIRKIPKVSTHRSTVAAEETGVMSAEKALQEAPRIMKRLKPIVGEVKNMGRVMMLAAILSAGFMALGGGEDGA